MSPTLIIFLKYIFHSDYVLENVIKFISTSFYFIYENKFSFKQIKNVSLFFSYYLNTINCMFKDKHAYKIIMKNERKSI